MKKYAIIDGQTVINVIEYEDAPSNPPPGFEAPVVAIQSDVAGPGWKYENGMFSNPFPPSEIVTIPEMTTAEKLASIGLTVEELKALLASK